MPVACNLDSSKLSAIITIIIIYYYEFLMMSKLIDMVVHLQNICTHTHTVKQLSSSYLMSLDYSGTKRLVNKSN